MDTQYQQQDTAYTLVGDTLFSNQDFKVFIGQRIIISTGSGERGWYTTISFKSGASWPLLLLKKAETEQNLDYQLDHSIRERDKVKAYLHSGDTLIVTKIKRFGKKRLSNWYRVSMGQKQGLLSLNFHCDIINAIRTKEILVPEL